MGYALKIHRSCAKEQNREGLGKYGAARISEPGELRHGVWANCNLFPGTDGKEQETLPRVPHQGSREVLTLCLPLGPSQRGSERRHQKVLLTQLHLLFVLFTFPFGFLCLLAFIEVQLMYNTI